MDTKSAPAICILEPRGLSVLPPEPLVSILLANYNYAGYLSESVESVLSQSYKNWELVICDDGSTDDSVAVIERFAKRDSRIQWVRQPNGGHTSALNTAYALSRGEVLCFLDSDDLFLPEKLEKVVSACHEEPLAGVITHRVIRIDEHRRRQGVWPISNHPGGWLGPELLKGGGVLPYAPPTSGIALRREIAELLFPVSTRRPLHMCPDQVIIRLAPLLTSIKRMPESLAEYRVHNANTYSQRGVSAQSVKRQLEVSRALWQEQHDFLSGMQPALAAQLSALEASHFTAMLQYMEAKLLKAPNVDELHQKFLDVSKQQGDEKWLPFWRLSIYLPNFLFSPAINLLLGQGALKQFVTRLRKLA